MLANSPPTLRLGGPDDAAAVAETVLAAFATHAGRLAPPSGALAESAQSLRAKLADDGVLLAEAAGRAVGCVMFRVEDRATLYLHRLAVLPEWRGRGLASALIGRLEAEARARGCTRLALGVRLALADNRRLFERLGFREVGREAHPGFAEPTSARMEKLLAYSSESFSPARPA